MLERYTESHLARPRRRLGPVALSIAAHIAAVAGLVIAAAWRIDKLDTADPPVLMAGIALPVASGGEEQPAAEPERPRHRHRVARDTVQPSPRTDQAPPPGDSTPGPGGGGPGLLSTCAAGQECLPDLLVGVTESVCGNGVIDGGEECDDGGRAAGDGCSEACAREPKILPSTMIEGHRIAGDPQIPPPPPVHAAMLGKRQREIRGTVRMCLDRGGAVTSLRVLRSTGYPAYDERLTSRMQTWRYRPYELSDGNRVPVCTAVTFIYRIQ